MLGSGILLWVGGNGLVTWAEMRASSGLAALLVAAMPIWGELITMVVDRRLPTAKMVGSILLGFAGVAVLSWPVLRTGTTRRRHGRGRPAAGALVLGHRVPSGSSGASPTSPCRRSRAGR